jgi:protease-4
MKQFIKMTLASATGVILAALAMGLLFFVIIVGMVAQLNAGAASEYIPKPSDKILKLSVSGKICDAVRENPLAMLIGESGNLSLKDMQEAIRKAKDTPSIQGIYLDIGVFSAGIANVDALRRSLTDFKANGKFIIAYADNFTQGGYYLASVADTIYMNPLGALGLTGFASQTLFYRGILEKAGIEMMVFKVGTYKGAVEPFIADKLSDANREQITSYLGSIWNNVVAGIAKSRNLPADSILRFADDGLFTADPAVAVERGLIDGLKYRSEVETVLMELTAQTGKQLKTVSMAKINKIKQKKPRRFHNKIAVVYAQGEIMQSPETLPLEMAQECITESLADELKKLKDDDQVKAVVLRVNSPGGSAWISDQIWKQMTELKRSKPVVVSMGAVAASGGYYISCAADKIVAEPNTLTGSIGIFGLFPNMTGLFRKLALTSDVVKTNRFADLGDPSRPMTNDEKTLIQTYIERGYDTFLARCAEGRHMSKEDIDIVGQGRVWTGEQAKERGLVDELGGLERAVEIAAEMADIYNYSIKYLPETKDILTDFLEKQMEETKLSIARDIMGDDYDYFRILHHVRAARGIQARLPYDFNPL